jgi:hypothetical protein
MYPATSTAGERNSSALDQRPAAKALMPGWARRILGVLCAGMALGFLLLGWWPFSPSPRNRVRWLSPGPGLSFEAPGVVYSAGAVVSQVATLPESFSVELFISPRGGPRAAAQYILSLHDGEVPSAFAVVQWKAELLLRIPDPSNVRGFREVAVGGLDGPARLFTIVCRGSGTEIFVDGRPSRRFPQFRVPAAAWRGRLVLGDAASGKQAWTGEVRGLALVERAMDSDLIARRSEAWRSGNTVQLRAGLGSGGALRFLMKGRVRARRVSRTCTPTLRFLRGTRSCRSRPFLFRSTGGNSGGQNGGTPWSICSASFRLVGCFFSGSRSWTICGRSRRAGVDCDARLVSG